MYVLNLSLLVFPLLIMVSWRSFEDLGLPYDRKCQCDQNWLDFKLSRAGTNTKISLPQSSFVVLH